MAKEVKKTSQIPKYKAANVQRFKEWYNDNFPCYEELCSGNAVKVDVKNKHVIDWINNKIIVKE